MRSTRRLTWMGAVTLAIVCLAGPAPVAGEAGSPRPGGRLVVALRSEPTTLNPTTALRSVDLAVIQRLHAALVSIDRQTLEPVPALAESWRVSAGGRVIDFELRRGVRFSDGEDFDAEDVVLTFEAILDPELPSPDRSSFVAGGAAVSVTATGSHAVRIDLGAPRAAGVRLLDGISILPSHRVRPLIEDGTWAGTWDATTPSAEMVGLGPFRLARHQPGERLVVERNPHYWKRDARGRALPYLDEIEFVFVSDENAEVVRFAAGDTDLIDSLTPESFLALQRGGDDRIMTDVGPGLSYSLLVFNMNDLEGREPGDVASRQVWFRDRRFRQAVSLAIDRDGIARVVYRGRAAPLATHQSPAVETWSHPDLQSTSRNLQAARQKLSEAGFTSRGVRLIDADGREVRFSVLVNAANATRRRIAALLQEDLRRVGIAIDIVPFDQGSLVQRVTRTFEYDAVLLAIGPLDTDPTTHTNTLVSGGTTHLWRMTDSPVLDWERELDRLMREQATTLRTEARRRLYWKALELVARELPFIPLVSPNVLVGRRAGLGGVRPRVFGNHLLWNAEELYWKAGAH